MRLSVCCRAGIVFLEGLNLQSVQYTATGTGKGYISGVFGQALVSLTGQTDLYVEAGKGEGAFSPVI